MGGRSSRNLVERDCSLESIAIDAKRRNWDARRFSCSNARLGSSGGRESGFSDFNFERGRRGGRSHSLVSLLIRLCFLGLFSRMEDDVHIC